MRSHWAGLDGLRGVAALAVVLFHAGFAFANGYAGVDVFFVLSGFLITAILLREHERTGGIALGRFYLRRALRLYPALLALAVGTLLLAAVTGRLTVLAPAVAAVVLYVSNWWIYLGHEAPLLTHTWTLAIEEHFYLLWPVVLLLLTAAARARRVAGLALLALGALALVLPWPDGIDAVRASYLRGVPLLWGCALAWFLHRRGRPLPLPRSVLGLSSLVLLALIAVPVRLPESLVTGPFGLAGILSVVVVAAIAAGPDGRGEAWSSAPLVWLGRRSYGLYLYHLPILSLLAHQVSVGPTWARQAAGIVVSLVVTALSYRFLESPFLRLKDRRVAPSR